VYGLTSRRTTGRDPFSVSSRKMVKLGMLTLIVPRIVLNEFARNRERIAKESLKSLSSHFRLVKEAGR